jgi:hypothetical protein
MRWIVVASLLMACAEGDGDSATPDVAVEASEPTDTTVEDTTVAVDSIVAESTPDTAKPEDPIAESLVGADVPSPRVGMFYLAWHAPPASVMPTLTIEDLVRSDGAKKLADVMPGREGDAMSFFYHVKPKLGFYCIYRARSGETGHVPDCANIETTLTTHAAQLIAAGVDHVVLDATNLTSLDRASDLLQLRPIEVLFEEWAKLRGKGVKTPQIAVWHAIPKGSTQWTGYQKIYANPAYDGLVMRDKKSGKKVFFYVDPPDAGRFPDPTIMTELTAKGDVVLQAMWTIDKTDASINRWAFMSWCQDGGKITTNIVGAPPCSQPHTAKSTLGTAIAVAPSFQTGYGSLPFGSAGRLSGLTFKRQWATAFAVKPEYVFVSGWNEFTAQPQPNPYTGDIYAKSVGMENDPQGDKLFVDTFGAELGRDIEPTVEYGSLYYELAKSCIRVFRKGSTCDASEPCCDLKSSEDQWTNVWALFNSSVNDTLLTTSRAERDALVASGWREICSRYGTPTLFCLRGDEPKSPAGPFIALAKEAVGRKALYRCLTGSKHFYSLDPACEGQKTESVLAYLAQSPTSETPRRARRCYRSSVGDHFVALGGPCPSGTADEGVLGFVH